MASATDSVSEALDSVLDGDNADTQTATTLTPEVTTEDVVAAAAAAAISESTPAGKTSATGATGKKDPVPYDRFSEVVGQKNEATTRLDALEAKFNDATTREDTLREQVGTLESEHQILEAIRALGKDERYSDAVNRIDKALQGVHEEEAKLEAASVTGAVDDQRLQSLSAKLDTEVESLRGEVASQKVDALYEKSQSYAGALLDSLPEEYSDVDRERLSELWSPRVDWDRIEAEGQEAIPEVLKDSFVSLIRDYKAPQGAIEARLRTEITTENPAVSFKTPDEIVQGLTEKDFAALDDEGTPVVSDDQFTSDIAELLRATRQ